MIIKIDSKLKVIYFFVNHNFIAKKLLFSKTFQHENVFGTVLTIVLVGYRIIILLLTFEVNYKLTKLKFNPNKMYESKL